MVLTLLFTFVFTGFAGANCNDDNNCEPETVTASFFLLNEGLPVPVGVASQPVKNYSDKMGEGTVVKENYFNLEGCDDRIISAPDLNLPEGKRVLWYVIKDEGWQGGWHVDGVVVPYYMFAYHPNAEDVTGQTSDGTHYDKDQTAIIKENGFAREGYEFVGWNTEADGSGKDVAPGSEFEISKQTEDINIISLYAQWKKVEVKAPAEEIELGFVCPKKMSVRFEDGTIYKGGESLKIEIGKEYKFQMCSNNWDNDTYADNGVDGIAGTVVYTVKVSNSYTERSYDPDTHTFVLPKGDPVLRTDVNKCFMAYRYHFRKGDYNKQTGIVNVINTPLESLSVNLPLGSTIKSDAYIKMEQIDSANVFIETDKTEGNEGNSYTDYYWEY